MSVLKQSVVSHFNDPRPIVVSVGSDYDAQDQARVLDDRIDAAVAELSVDAPHVTRAYDTVRAQMLDSRVDWLAVLEQLVIRFCRKKQPESLAYPDDRRAYATITRVAFIEEGGK